MAYDIKLLREKHPVFTYKSAHSSVEGSELVLNYRFEVGEEISFTPSVRVALRRSVDLKSIEGLVFNLGLVEMVSYWKATCSPTIVVEAAKLSPDQILWWRDLFIHGLGEFYFRNNIDFSSPDFVSISSKGQREFSVLESEITEGDLILVGGGKDSSLTLQLLNDFGQPRKEVFILNAIESAVSCAKVAGFSAPLLARRVIDPMLLDLNKRGYLNGHTPFSAYLAFLSTLVGEVNDFKNLITSNESSADEQNAIMYGIPINHQYSKSFRFEKMFREYSAWHLSSSTNYYSFLRPLHDLQVSRLFARNSPQLKAFRSCNVGQKEGAWCKKCPKCAFVYLSLYPFLSDNDRTIVFGTDLFLVPEIITHIQDLVGLGDHKPFECVGTEAESRAALILSFKKMLKSNSSIPPGVDALVSKIPAPLTVNTDWIDQLLSDLGSRNFLPPHYEKMLRLMINS